MYDGATYSFQVEHYGDGIFSTFSGASESSTWNPTETQMLFSFIGGYSNLSFTHGTWEGDGILYNFAGGDERASFDWVGSGEIKLRSNKPDHFLLSELADYKLYDIKSRWLGSFQYEPSDEKHTECYNESAFVEFFDLDYGSLVDLSNTAVTPLSTQTIGTSTAPTGVVRVGQNEVVTISGTYTVPSTTTVPTTFIDYNLVNETQDELLNHGHILHTVSMGQPFGEIYVTGVATAGFQPCWNGRGGVKLVGDSHSTHVRDEVGDGHLLSLIHI